jgi:hypothetical protein
MPVMAIYQSDHITPDEYADFRARLPLTAAPHGALVHAHGGTDKGFVTFEVWENREALQSFLDGVLAPAVRDMGLPFVAPAVVEVDDFVVTQGVRGREIPYGVLGAVPA